VKVEINEKVQQASAGSGESEMYLVIWLHILLSYGLLNHRLSNHRLRLNAGAPIEVEKGVAIGLTADGERLGDGGSARSQN
jgi:hypothetical protein